MACGALVAKLLYLLTVEMCQCLLCSLHGRRDRALELAARRPFAEQAASASRWLRLGLSSTACAARR
eukprot:6182893-Pleurochrysis_carterae.AAC.1